MDQGAPTVVALGHGGGQRQGGLQGHLPRVLARSALDASVDPLDLPLRDLGFPTGGKSWKVGWGLNGAPL